MISVNITNAEKTFYFKRNKKNLNETNRNSELSQYDNFINRRFHTIHTSFKGKNATSLAEISDINCDNLDKLLLDIKNSGKNVVIVSDYDGVHTDFGLTRMSASPIANPYYGEDNFLHVNNELNTNDIPFTILTTRSLDKLKSSDVMGEKIANSINVICLNGNQMRLTLNKNERTMDFIKKWQAKKDYTTSVYELPGNKLKVKVDPIIPKELKTINEKYNDELKPLGFDLNNESLIMYFKWNRFFNEQKDSSEENPFIITVNDNIYKNVKTWQHHQKKEKSDNKTILIKTIEGNSIQISYNDLVEYGLTKFKQICFESYGERMSFNKLNFIPTQNLGNIKALVSDQRDKRFFEIADIRSKATNKGVSLESLVELEGGKDNVFPIFLGDSISGQNDDEFAMKKADDLGGAGIAILMGNSRDNRDERLSLYTRASYKLESFKDTAPFLLSIANSL